MQVYADTCMQIGVCVYVCTYVCMYAWMHRVLTISAPGQSVPRRMLGAARTQDSGSWRLIFLLIMPVELDIRVCTLPPFGKWWTSTMHTSPLRSCSRTTCRELCRQRQPKRHKSLRRLGFPNRYRYRYRSRYTYTHAHNHGQS